VEYTYFDPECSLCFVQRESTKEKKTSLCSDQEINKTEIQVVVLQCQFKDYGLELILPEQNRKSHAETECRSEV
jgi:hypothetical protein